MVEVKRYEGESMEKFLRRFSRRVQQSGVILLAKKRRFFDPPISRNLKKKKAQKRGEIREKREYLRKVGLLDDIMELPPHERRKKLKSRLRI